MEQCGLGGIVRRRVFRRGRDHAPSFFWTGTSGICACCDRIVLFVLFGGCLGAVPPVLRRQRPAGDGESRVTAPTGVERFR